MPIGREHRRAWVSLLFSYSRLMREIEARLAAANHISLEVYDALLVLELSESHRLRMTDLADRMVMSRSGATRMVDRLVSCGYVQRESCPHDKRVQYARLTPEGLLARENAWPTYRAAIQELFSDRITVEEATVLAEALGRLGEPLPPEFDWTLD